MAVSKEFVQSVRKRLAQEPGLPTQALAEELGASEADVILCLPVAMRMRARSQDAPLLLQEFASLKHLVVSMGGTGRSGVKPRAASLAGPVSVRDGEIGSIWFVSKQREDGLMTRSLRFFGHGGEHLFSLYLGMDRQGRIDPHAKALFDGAKKRFGVVPVPRKSRCASACASCGCKDSNMRLKPFAEHGIALREIAL